jgi:hypothetical protein
MSRSRKKKPFEHWGAVSARSVGGAHRTFADLAPVEAPDELGAYGLHVGMMRSEMPVGPTQFAPQSAALTQLIDVVALR